jgi:1-acyl-sn-glycerol-3-phosphate acyltransferase
MSLVAVWTASWCAIWGPGALVTLAIPGRRGPWRTWCFQRWAAGILAILRVRVVTEGYPPSQGPFVLVANHLSYLDIMVLASRVRATFVAKREVRSWPVWGILARAVGTIFVDRDRARDTLRVADVIHGTLNQNDGVVIFPEGTSTMGSTVAPFRSSLLAAATRAALPVHYASLSYRTGRDDPPAHLAVCWWGDMEFLPHFRVLCGLDRIEAHVRFGREPVGPAGRKELAEALHRAVTRDFIPVVAHPS